MLRNLSIILTLFASPAVAESTVVTDIAPVQSLVAKVSGELPSVLIDGATDPHHFALRPSQIRQLTGADLLVTIGPGLLPWLVDEAKGVNADLVVITLAEEGTEHPWLDPIAAVDWLDRIADALAVADPDQAEAYRANASAARRELEALAQDLQARLTSLDGLHLVTDHDALSAFSDRFGIEVAESIADGHNHAPGAKHMAHLFELAHDGHVDCVIVTSDEGGHAAAHLAEDAGVPLVSVDLIGAGLQPGPDLYPQMLRRLADDLKGCAG